MRKTIQMTGMHCAACEKLIALAVAEVPGATLKQISHTSGQAELEMADAATWPAVRQAIEAEGYSIAKDSEGC